MLPLFRGLGSCPVLGAPLSPGTHKQVVLCLCVKMQEEGLVMVGALLTCHCVAQTGLKQWECAGRDAGSPWS